MIDKNKATALSPRRPFNGQRVLRISGSITRRIATWNVRSLYAGGKSHNVVREMKRLKIEVLGISEMRWPGSGDCYIDGYSMFYSGNDTPQHLNGVGVIVSPTFAQAVTNFMPISDRVMLMQFGTKPFNLNIIQVYAPTSDAEDDVAEGFYSDVKTALGMIKTTDICIVMGDFNAKVGDEARSNVVGKYGLGVPNERGHRLVEFCQEESLVVSNTFYKLPPRRLYTWESNANRDVRNQIDFILVRQRFRNMIKGVKTYPGADVYSDHNLLVATIKLQLKKCVRHERPLKWDTRKLLDAQIASSVAVDIGTQLAALHQGDTWDDVEHTWNSMKKVVVEACEKHLPADRIKEKPWMTDDILDLMDERRSYKNKDERKYREVHGRIRSDVIKAKEDWFAMQCAEIEEFEGKYDSFNMHRKIKQLTGQGYRRSNNVLLDEQGTMLESTTEKLREWERYIGTLYSDDRTVMSLGEVDGPLITRSEVERALASAKSGRALGPDAIPIEIFKVLKEEKSLSLLVELFNKVYTSGTIPVDWLRSTFIMLPKKVGARRCGDFRTISLMSHILKLFLKIIHFRIYTKCEGALGDSQFGFRGGLGTREALFSIQVLIQRCRDINVPVYACFLDYEKAFDTVKHDRLVTILQRVGLDGRDIRIILNLYWNQRATVRVEGEISEEIRIERGVRQGCVLSPILFNLYSEDIFREALAEREEGVVVNGFVVNNIRYADDTVLLATSIEDLQSLLTSVAERSGELGLRLNKSKTRWMVVSRVDVDSSLELRIGQDVLDRVATYRYLGCVLNEDWDCSREIRCRIEQARGSFVKMRNVLTNRSLNLPLRLRILRCYVFSVLYYGLEAWTLTEATCNKLQAFEIWTYRRMLKIPWVDRVTNVEVLRKLNKSPEVLGTVKRRKLEYFGHVMRNQKYELLQVIMQGVIVGRRGRGRRRTSWLKNLRQWFGLSSTDLFRAAVDKQQIVQLVADVLGGHGT